MYKNAKVTRQHCRLVVRKCWRLYLRWQVTRLEVDKEQYFAQRKDAERAIESGPADWKKEMQLP
ncbi:MAG: hypothetical protein KGL39_37335 [Patescibacteria group bacterium]|nr:hypothetical protein [Patescibacteria group bacterium]